MRRYAVLVVMLFTAMVAASGHAVDQTLARTKSGDMPTICQTFAADAQTSSPPIDSTLADGLPPGLALDVLADRATTHWPEFARGLVLTIRQLSLKPDAVSAMRRTEGPLLFYVASGTAGVSVNGQTETYAAGGAVLVETGQNYLLRNDAPDPAILLRLALAPPDEETTVSNKGGVAQVLPGDLEVAADAGAIESLMLATADIPTLDGAAHLFIGCLSWTDPHVEPGVGSYPGPVGLWVLDGRLLVGDAQTLERNETTVFQSEAPRRLRAGDPPPVVLMFGVIPQGEPLWTAAQSTRIIPPVPAGPPWL
ncbi:MAG: hypothetical protein H0V00_07935 [Chloroflexia bacterium]|nr:hypothetical protein [Chloroflexia bacterium]